MLLGKKEKGLDGVPFIGRSHFFWKPRDISIAEF